jgi:predicted house-cleaning noncanonical NTP pyrophosphatase (MazG superfamily)
MAVKVYNKLVRDLVIEIIRKEGKRAFWHKATKKELLKLCPKKIIEEVRELRKNPCAEEAGDVQEIISYYFKLLGINEEDVRKAMEEKAKKKGAFNEGIVLEKVKEDD